MNYPMGFDYPPYFQYPQPSIVPQRGARPLRYEIIHVTGRNGADALAMAPNSSAIALDDTAPLVWLCQTDSAGYKTVTPYSIAPYTEPEPVSMNELNERLARLEEMLSAKPDPKPVKQPAKYKNDSAANGDT